MPTTFTGLLLFLILLLPGFVFLWIYTFDRPTRPLTTLQETGAVAFASVASTLATLALATVAHATLPHWLRVDVHLLITGPADYLIKRHWLLAGWFLGALITACVLAALAGMLARSRPVHPSVASSWWTLFEYWHPGTTRYVQCELDNGSYVAGMLGDWNTIQEDSPDRDLILSAPITFRPGPDRDYQHHPVSAVCVSASRIVVMFVSYSDTPPTSYPPSAAEAGVAAESSAEPAEGGDPAPRAMDLTAGYDQARQPPV